MRWQPDTDRCPECGFDWTAAPSGGISLVTSSPQRIRRLVEGADALHRPAPQVWSASEYVWHLVDVLRIGSERLLTAAIDPASGIPCWDENALADVRKYGSLSPRVGLIAYESAVKLWLDAANAVSLEASVEHPQFGTLTVADLVRRNAHEVHHHELDIRRGATRGPG